MKKYCIFHVPNFIDPAGKSGSQVRPIKMLKAFEKIGYNVDIVMGNSKTRKKQIKLIKSNIKDGKKYDFLYSESSTMPTLLTESHHLPLNPTLDFSFFKFCKQNGVKIGLFYRDMHWNYESYRQRVSYIKRTVSRFFYKYDLKKYNEILDALFVPSFEFFKKIPSQMDIKAYQLYPGIDKKNTEDIASTNIYEKNKKILNIFYVGGIGETYEISHIFKLTKELEFIKLVVCCRKEEWKSEKYRYEAYMNPRITIIHKSGEKLNEHYENSDLVSLYYKDSKYRHFSMPIKLFEYLSYIKPIIATNSNVADEFVKEYNVGWNIDYSYEKLKEKISHIYLNQNIIDNKRKNIAKILKDNTWESRACSVKEVLVRK